MNENPHKLLAKLGLFLLKTFAPKFHAKITRLYARAKDVVEAAEADEVQRLLDAAHNLRLELRS